MGNPSGKFVVRLSPKLHASLRRRAQKDGTSLNALCEAAMKTYLGEAHTDSSSEPVVRQVEALLGHALVGVVLFGSEARGEARESSDKDLLIVVENDLPLTRSLYSRWDLSFGGAPTSTISPHFVHFPKDAGSAGSIWCEAALDGVLLFDRDRRVFHMLRAIRRQMAEGRLRRRSAYGHPYWVRGAEEVKSV